MVDVAQLVRVSVCGTEGRGFEPRLPPQNRKGLVKTRPFCFLTNNLCTSVASSCSLNFN